VQIYTFLLKVFVYYQTYLYFNNKKKQQNIWLLL